MILPYNPLPLNSRAIGLSSRRGAKWDGRIRDSVRETHGENCYYCDSPPGLKNHDCHEVFDIDDRSGTIRLVDIVPACEICHVWADGKIFVSGILSESLYWTKAELDKSMKKHGLFKHPSYDRFWDVYQYRNMRHFRKVNRTTFAEARKYLKRAEGLRRKRDKANVKWRIDYCGWTWAAEAKSQKREEVRNHVV